MPLPQAEQGQTSGEHAQDNAEQGTACYRFVARQLAPNCLLAWQRLLLGQFGRWLSGLQTERQLALHQSSLLLISHWTGC